MQELSDENKIERIADHIRAIIELVGEDPQREGLVKTPERAAKALWYLTSGYRTDPSSIASQALFTNEGSRMVMVRDVEFYSLCEHHILPFFGKVTIAYIPDEKIVGLSKIARLVNVFARRLQVQERFTAQLCQFITDALGAKGVMVSCTAQHLCMKMRGVEKQDSSTTTIHTCGLFDSDPSLRAEFFASIK